MTELLNRDELIRRLDEYRLKNKISQAKLAFKLGVAFNTVNRWFNNKGRPNKMQTYHIQELLKKSKSVLKNADGQ